MLSQARYLIAVADHGSFTRASIALRISQPALSQQVKQLEDSLGVKLLDRSGLIIKATDAGRAYINHARRALQSFDAGQRAIHDVENLSEGVLRLGFSPLFTTYLVGPIVQEFHARYPGIFLTVEIQTQADMEKAIINDECDIGLGFGDLVTEDVQIEPLHKEQLCLIVGKLNPVYSKRVLPVRKIDPIDLALLNSSFVTRATIDLYLRTNSVRSRIALETNSVDSLVAIVQQSRRLATIMPETTARGIPNLRAIRLNPPIAVRTTAALLRKDSYHSAASRVFLTMLKKRDWTSEANKILKEHKVKS